MSDMVRNDRTKSRNDLILIVVFLAAAALALLLCRGVGAKGAFAVVTYDGAVVEKYPLNEERVVLLVPGREPLPAESVDEARALAADSDYNILVIKSGEAEVVEASCRDKLCVKQHAAKKTADVIVCLPNKTTVSIEGDTGKGDDGQETDLISN